MSLAAANGLLLSNHSYSYITGWYHNGEDWYWYGNTAISSTEDYRFGFYNANSMNWDQIAFSAPYYLIVKSAGNERSILGPVEGEGHYVWESAGWVWSTEIREKNGGADGYDCLDDHGVSKNILTVGAVYDIPAGYNQPSGVGITTFSSWGPTDDGRIKPDLVANGYQLLSSVSDSDNSYANSSGTSMSSPSACGSLVLLQQHYQNLNEGNSLLSATLKALVIHTADEAGTSDGPDYEYGWGLLNTAKAASLITEQKISSWMIQERSLAAGEEVNLTLFSEGTQPIRTSICWTDPAGTPVSPSLNPETKMLVNDLDLRILENDTIHFPWKLDFDLPGNAACRSDNNSDNVEQVFISSPGAGAYTVNINHKGALLGNHQDFSLIISGATMTPPEPANVAITIASGYIYLSWEEVIGASSYRVYASDDPNLAESSWILKASGLTVTTWSEELAEDRKFFFLKAVK